MLRRNVGIKVLLFNNRIYGLTKGQYSPTSEFHKVTKSTPYGSPDRPFNPVSLAIGAEATFVARSVDVFQSQLKDVLRAAAVHKGSAFVEILQNCNIFNDGAWEGVTEKEARSEHVIQLEHGKPLIFGKNKDKGIRRKSRWRHRSRATGQWNHRSRLDRPRRASSARLPMLSCSHTWSIAPASLLPSAFSAPGMICRASKMWSTSRFATSSPKKGPGKLNKLLRAGDIWEVK